MVRQIHKGARSFFQVLQGGKPQEVYGLFYFLEHQFDGDVFSVPKEEQQTFTKDVLIQFANLVEARTLKQQRYL